MKEFRAGLIFLMKYEQHHDGSGIPNLGRHARVSNMAIAAQIWLGNARANHFPTTPAVDTA